MCYYLNVQFQGQRVKPSAFLLTTVQSGSGPSLNSLRSAGVKTGNQRTVVTTSLESFSKDFYECRVLWESLGKVHTEGPEKKKCNDNIEMPRNRLKL